MKLNLKNPIVFFDLEKTGVIKELRSRQAFEKPSVANRKKIMRTIYVQKMQQAED